MITYMISQSTTKSYSPF